MELMRGCLKITIQRGINLVVRDAVSSDPYCVISMGSQKLKTRVKKKTCNPVWNEVLTLTVTNASTPIKLVVFDKDRFTEDDRMGDAVIDIKPYIECLQLGLEELPVGTAVKKVQPSQCNCLAAESKIIWTGEGKMVQDMVLKLQNVEKGNIKIQIEWLSL